MLHSINRNKILRRPIIQDMQRLLMLYEKSGETYLDSTYFNNILNGNSVMVVSMRAGYIGQMLFLIKSGNLICIVLSI